MIVGMTIVTYIPRFLPLLILTKINIPEILVRWLKYIPVAILASLLAPGLLIYDNHINFTIDNIYLIAAIPTFFLAVYKRSIFLTVLTGMITVIILHYVLL